MKTTINNLDDVRAYAKELIGLNLSFHPDEDFANYVILKTGEPTFTENEVLLHNTLTAQCFDVCECENRDIYSFMLDIALVETGMDQYIPRPTHTA